MIIVFKITSHQRKMMHYEIPGKKKIHNHKNHCVVFQKAQNYQDLEKVFQQIISGDKYKLLLFKNLNAVRSVYLQSTCFG